MATLRAERQRALERAMREWARTDPAVADSVRAADHTVVAAVRQAFQDAGFDPDGRNMRAHATFAAGIVSCISPMRRPAPGWPPSRNASST